MPSTTSRLALTQPITADGSSGLRAAITSNASILDNALLYSEGTISARPAATTVEHGHLYYGTDTGLYYQSNGTVWGTVLVAGVWQTITVFGTGISAGSYYTPSARVEGDVVRLSGQIVNLTGGTLTNGTELFSAPAGTHPAHPVGLTFASNLTGAISAIMNVAGVCTVSNGATPVAIGDGVYLDGAMYRLT